MKHFDYTTLARANTVANQCAASIRLQPEHFDVDEQLPFNPDGSGGHVWLKIQKKGMNTDWLANKLAEFSGVVPVAIGYAGMKDRYAVTRQWFSINLEGYPEPDWTLLETSDCHIVECTRHGKKLKRGILAGNHFKLRLSNIKGDKSTWLSSLELIKKQGVPNYFGEQRFGINNGNLYRADAWFISGRGPKKRLQKSLYLSAARSWLFNNVLSQRIQLRNWNEALAGDMMLLAGTKASLFHIDVVDEAIQSRIERKDIHPSGPMYGRGDLPTTLDVFDIEQRIMDDWNCWCIGLEKAGLKQERRALRVIPQEMRWQYVADDQLELAFFLPAGSYATAVLRELAIVTDNHQRNYTATSVI